MVYQLLYYSEQDHIRIYMYFYTNTNDILRRSVLRHFLE